MESEMYENLMKISDFCYILAEIILVEYLAMSLVNIFIYASKVRKLEKKGFFIPILSLIQINYTAMVIAWAKIIQSVHLLP
jgi:hypothetical protein